MKAMKSIFILVATVVLGSACGNGRSTPDLSYAALGTGGQPPGNLNTNTQTSCTQTNIQGNAPGFQFRGCRGQTYSSIRIIPAGNTPQNVCVFAATNGVPLMNAQNGNPVYVCDAIPAAGKELNFTGVNLNSVVIAPAGQASNNLYWCMANYPQYLQQCAQSIGVNFAAGSI
jgi:hypothetical protein